MGPSWSTLRRMSHVVIRFDFYRARLDEGDKGTLVDYLDHIAQLPDDDSRNWQYPLSTDVVRLTEFETTPEQRLGEFARIRMNNVPAKANVGGGPLAELGLDEDEGCGESTAFLYDVGTRVLLLQAHRPGVSAARVASYVARLSSSRPIYLDPVESEDTLERFRSMRDVTRFQVALAPNYNADGLQELGLSVSEISDLLQEARAPRLELILSRGSQRRGFLPKKILKWALDFQRESSVEKLQITGTTDDKAADVLDLLEARMTESTKLEVNGQRRIPFKTKKQELLNAWQKHAPDLRRRYPT